MLFNILLVFVCVLLSDNYRGHTKQMVITVIGFLILPMAIIEHLQDENGEQHPDLE